MHTAAEVIARTHLAKAEEYWLHDLLGKAHAAMGLALNAGVHPSDVFDRQRTIDAELAARTHGELVRLDEHLMAEVPQDCEPKRRDTVLSVCWGAWAEVGQLWNVHWGKPVLITIFGSRDAALFMHSRYGYYAERREVHKVCLPPDVAQSRGLLEIAALHEIAHAAVHDVAGDAISRWLDEGIAVWTEGGSSPVESRRLRLAALHDRVPSIERIEAAFGNYAVDLDSGQAAIAYAVAGSFVGHLVETSGLLAMRHLLRQIRHHGDTPRTFRRALGFDQRRAEREWRSRLASG